MFKKLGAKPGAAFRCSQMRAYVALGLIAAGCLPSAAWTMSLPEAIAVAQKANPALAQSKAQAEAADARLSQAHAGRLPSVVVSGQSGWGSTDLSGFFGFGRSKVSPSGAALEISQPLFAGGAINAAIDRARENRDAALAQLAGAKALLSVQVAQAYVTVLSADQILALNKSQVRRLDEVAKQAALKFKDGESPITEVDQAQARLAAAQADLARANGDVARARARFVRLSGLEPNSLAPPSVPLQLPANLDEARRAPSNPARPCSPPRPPRAPPKPKCATPKPIGCRPWR